MFTSKLSVKRPLESQISPNNNSYCLPFKFDKCIDVFSECIFYATRNELSSHDAIRCYFLYFDMGLAQFPTDNFDLT